MDILLEWRTERFTETVHLLNVFRSYESYEVGFTTLQEILWNSRDRTPTTVAMQISAYLDVILQLDSYFTVSYYSLILYKIESP